MVSHCENVGVGELGLGLIDQAFGRDQHGAAGFDRERSDGFLGDAELARELLGDGGGHLDQFSDQAVVATGFGCLDGRRSAKVADALFDRLDLIDQAVAPGGTVLCSYWKTRSGMATSGSDSALTCWFFLSLLCSACDFAYWRRPNRTALFEDIEWQSFFEIEFFHSSVARNDLNNEAAFHRRD